MAFYRKRIWKPDTERDVAERIARQSAADIALAETNEKFPVLTAENFAEADAYRERRVAEILRDR